MCNHYRADPTWVDRTGEFSHLRLPPFAAGRARPNVQGPDIWPGYMGEIAAVEDGRLAALGASWRLIPPWFKGAAKDWARTSGGCNNARGETAATNGVFKTAARAGRCLIPGEAFFEYAAERDAEGRKPEYRFTPADGRPFFFAGLYGHATPAEGPMLTFTMVTKPGGPDTGSIGHPRQPLILMPDELAAWLDPTNPIDGFLAPSPAGSFVIELAPPRPKKM